MTEDQVLMHSAIRYLAESIPEDFPFSAKVLYEMVMAARDKAMLDHLCS